MVSLEIVKQENKESSLENPFAGGRRRRRFTKNKSYLLAVIKPGDEEHPLVKEFLASLPLGTNKVLDSFGYTGSLSDHLDTLRHESDRALEDQRHFVLYRTSDIEELPTNYFTVTEKASVHVIPDILAFRMIYYGLDDLLWKRYGLITKTEMSVNEALAIYNERSSKSSKRLLCDAFNYCDGALEELTQKKWFGLSSERKFPTTHILMGIETPELGYLLTTCYKGPLKGTITGRKIRFK